MQISLPLTVRQGKDRIKASHSKAAECADNEHSHEHADAMYAVNICSLIMKGA